MKNNALSVTLAFVDQINQGNVRDLERFLARDHTFIDISGKTQTGARQMAESWQVYLEKYPEYRIFINRIIQNDKEIYLIGHTTGSHLELPEDVEFITEGVIWKSVVEEGKIITWQLYKDTLQNYEMINLNNGREIFAAACFARTIAKHLDILPPGARTADVQNVREYYSRLYHKASPQTIFEIAEHLLFDEGYRLVPYELIHFHQNGIKYLDQNRVERLSQGIEDAYTADIFARYITGPAWDKGVIQNDLFDRWITHPNLWLRRAAIMSTIHQNKDTERVFNYAAYLVNDNADEIIDALSTVLRAAVISDYQHVKSFIDEHKQSLPPSVIEIIYADKGIEDTR